MRLPIILGFSGYRLTTAITSLLKDTQALGVILFSNNIKDKQQLRELILDLRNFDPEILIAIDCEGGAICRFSRDIPVIASAKAMGRECNWGQIKQNLEIMAQTLSFFDIDLNFAPVLDLENKDAAQVIQNRGFFPDPQLIRHYNDIFVSAHQKYGVHTVAKHFFGLAKIKQDPHSFCSVYEGTEQDLAMEFSCYQGFLEKEVTLEQSIMTSHILVPSLDTKEPITFSSSIVQTYLRNKLQFKGIVFSDCLEMAASSKLYNPSDIAQKTLLANHDILLSSGQIKPPSFMRALAKGLQSYLLKEPEQAMVLANKIKFWREKIKENKVKTTSLPDYCQTVQLNKIFVEKKIYFCIKKITDFQLVASAEHSDIIEKFRENFPQLEVSDPAAAVDLQQKTLVLVVSDTLLNHEQLYKKITNLISAASQTLILAVSTSAYLTCNEEWILWGKNHLMLDALLELFKEKQ